MIKSIIHKEDRHHKQLDSLITKTKINKAKLIRNIREKKKHIIIARHINISLRIFYQVQKK